MTDRSPISTAADASSRSDELHALYSPRTAEDHRQIDLGDETNWGPAPF